MKKELNELANQLQTLAANYEEAVRPTVTWDTQDWRDALENLYQESNQRVDLRGETPLVVVHEMFMHLTEAWEEIDRIHGRRNPPRGTQRGLDEAIEAARQARAAQEQMQRDMTGMTRFFDWPGGLNFTGPGVVETLTVAPELPPPLAPREVDDDAPDEETPF